MKQKRQEAIRDLIAREAIDTQDILTIRLIELGFPVTQATVSRDIKEMRLIKRIDHNGKARYQAQGTAQDDDMQRKLRIFAESVLSIDGTGNLLLLRTVAGGAQNPAGTLDDMNLPEVLGCIAGDDTILVIVRTEQGAEALMEKVKGMMK